ncbi:MAG TPA: hypothetical protein VJB65_02765 [Patescibacteria group bacterium]|nr:hypothetical protein [Patescibacteria group bacterium]
MQTKKSLLIGAALFAASGFLLLGAGCGKSTPAGNDTNSTNTNQQSTNTNANSNSAILVPSTIPSGNDAQDEAAMQQIIEQMGTTSHTAAEAVDEVENGADVDIYTLEQVE